MSSLIFDEAAATAVTVGDSGAAVTRPVPGNRHRLAEWWQTWRARFGLAEVCGTAAALLGFAAGYLAGRSLLAAAALATICEMAGFYGCVGAKTAAAAWRATAHLGGWRRLAAGAWHAVREQLASCAAAEAMDSLLIRPGCIAGAALLLRPLPAGVWLGFAVGKVAADVAWYGMEATARHGVAWSTAKPGAKQATPYLALDLARATERYDELAAALPGVAIHYAVKANPERRLLARLHAAGCRFEVASWAEVRAVLRAGADPATVLFTNPVKAAGDIARARRAGVWQFAADSCGELRKIAENAPGAAVLFRFDTGAVGTVGDQGKFGAPAAQVPSLARLAASLGLNPYGLAFHVGSQMMDPAAWDSPIRQCAQIMTALADDGITLAMLDLGGGFPVRYDIDPPPLAEYAAAISRAAACLPYPVQLACEPGRAIAAPAGTMVASVIGVARRYGTVRVSLDTGAFHGLIEALESGRELRFPVSIPGAGHRTLVPCTLTGPSCDSQDTILDGVWLPAPDAGDRVLIGNAGAYTTCYSGRSAFNGYPAPVVKVLSRGWHPAPFGILQGRSPRLTVAGEVGQRVDVLGLVDVARRGGEGGVRPDPDHHPGLLPCHPLDLGQLRGRDVLLGHQVDDPAQHVHRLAEVLLERGVPVDLQVGHRPLLVQDAQADLGVPPDGERLAAGRHGRDQQVIAVQDVVHDRHGGPVVPAVVPEDAGPVLPHELPALDSVHACPFRRRVLLTTDYHGHEGSSE
jgi:ornithine decarboxylase